MYVMKWKFKGDPLRLCNFFKLFLATEEESRTTKIDNNQIIARFINKIVGEEGRGYWFDEENGKWRR